MSKVSIRGASLNDAPAIANLISQLGYPTSTAQIKDRLTAVLHNSDYMTFVAEIHKEVVGVIGVSIGYPYEIDEVYGRLLALVVDEKWQGNGIGSSLVERAEKWLREHKVTSITVSSGKHRSAAHSFYKQLGYEETGLRFTKSFL